MLTHVILNKPPGTFILIIFKLLLAILFLIQLVKNCFQKATKRKVVIFRSIK